MDNHRYDPAYYHGPYPPPYAAPAGSFSSYYPPPASEPYSAEPPNHAGYPPPISPSSSFAGYPIDRPTHPSLYPSYLGHHSPPPPPPSSQPSSSYSPPPHLSPSHSYSSIQYPPPVVTAPPTNQPPPPSSQPSSLYSPCPHLSPSHSYSSIQYPPPVVTAPPTYQPPLHASSPPQYPTLQHHGSFNNPGILRFPPPHSDSFLAAYGGEATGIHDSTSSDSKPSYPPLDHLLADMKISNQGPPPPPPPVADHPSCPPPEASFSGSSSQRFNHEGPPTPLGNSGQLVPHKSSQRVLLLHGDLDVRVYYARNLPNLDMFSNTLANMMGSRKVTSDPYVTISAGSAVLGRTFVRDNNENPTWDQHFHVPVAHCTSKITFTVKDDDFVGSQVIGTVDITAEQIFGGMELEGDYPILSNGKPCKPGAILKLLIKYIPVEELNMYRQGIEPGPNYSGVPGTYFPLRKGGEVKLYQDAHVPDGCLPDIWMGGGIRYEHGRCWHDICKAISEARKLIYIVGWSVYHNVRLVRDVAYGSKTSNTTLGELLRMKSSEGVRVLLLIWDDPTSRRILGVQKDGIMDTHDEETRKFFKHSSVQVLLCPRSAGKRHSWMKKQEAGLIYTHHQKSVIVDADAGNYRRKIIAFIGGLDLCKGRYDSPKHFLFRTLDTLHNDDFHNPNFTAVDDGGPREPWHDLHCRIDGPAAYDLLCNFQERWLKASKPHGLKKLSSSYDDKLLKIERIPEIIGVDESVYLNRNYPDSWHVQIFRSIDSNSVKGFPKDSKEVLRKNLAYGKNVLIDMSIHAAYVKAIRAAQHFIYIENQYFLGSSYNWSRHKNLGANNLIPMEIALKIANKIKSRERFSAYIVMPMWPEGVPTGKATQQILYWQKNTMQMMYETIYDALVEAGLENQYSPEDYLNFFCLGNREALDGKSLKSAMGNTPQALAQKNRRFMIYVHSKGMIVDDEYVIMGSANINQRSLEGTRDSEIAMGAYEPQHTWSRIPSGPRGQVYAYRMSLWAEHIGSVQECFNYPESVECTKWIRGLAEQNWHQFVSPQVSEMSGHLLKYPVAVDRKGRVSPLAGSEVFPDVGGKICGSFFGIEENLTI